MLKKRDVWCIYYASRRSGKKGRDFWDNESSDETQRKQISVMRCLCSGSGVASSVLSRRRRRRRANDAEERGQRDHAERKLKKDDARRRRTAVLVSSSHNDHESTSDFDV